MNAFTLTSECIQIFIIRHFLIYPLANDFNQATVKSTLYTIKQQVTSIKN